MPPKKTKTNSNARHFTYNSVSIQTEIDCNYETMICDYKKQINDLTKKIADYEVKCFKLQDENTILKHQNLKLLKSTSTSVLVKNDLIDNATIKKKSISTDIDSMSTKGCGCKGSCANKICGCVKKGVSCNKKLCKCNNVQCRNQDFDKENTANQNELSQESQKALEKLGRLTLNQEILHASEKKKKILLTDHENMMNVEKYSASPFGTRRRLFTQDSDDTVDVSVSESNSLLNNKECSNKPEIQFPHTTAVNHDRKLKNKDGQFKIIVTTDDIQNEIPLQLLSDKIDVGDNFLPKISKVLHSPKDVNKLKPHSSDEYIVRRRYKNQVSPSNEEIDEKKNIEEIVNSRKVQHLPKPSDKHQVLENEIKSSLSQVSDTTNSNNILDVSLNPMVPKRQLARSPISATGNIMPNESKRFSPPKKELAVPEVNWEQHKSELIMCRICKRKFFPHRIDKHVASCKGI
ncbi:uncharacterized protein LOC131671649 [Phymastichus coffea]|uniref:uncharacterized protein LOC131671649 n=1 Tax=Phymastichus coffea TaxID=108790 RepID=UPI00273B6887|nr:uncharacterized protein LOC131671649 [Phymastichus coffea]XP_058804224.1 uncharacterized protein LOC131671649 [Phymastichus coffea]